MVTTSEEFVQALIDGLYFYGESRDECNEVIEFLASLGFPLDFHLQKYFPRQGDHWRFVILEWDKSISNHKISCQIYQNSHLYLTYQDFLGIKDETSPIDSDGLVRGLCDLF